MAVYRRRASRFGGGIAAGVREELDLRLSDEFFRTGTTPVGDIRSARRNSGIRLRILHAFWLVAQTHIPAVYHGICGGVRPDDGCAAAGGACGGACGGDEPRPLDGAAGESFNTLSLAAVVVLILNPTSLFDTGAQLSFIAVVVLIWTSQWLRDRALSDDPLDRLIARTRHGQCASQNVCAARWENCS